MRFRQSLQVGIAVALLCTHRGYAAKATASPDREGAQTIPPVFLPVVPRFSHSPIPVFFPTWLPPLRGKLYPGFRTFRRQHGIGPGYDLGLYSSARYQDHAHRLFEIVGIAGDTYAVNTHTRPVWLEKKGWAYVDPDGNAGWTISFIRAVGHTRWPPTYLPEYTYTAVGGCEDGTVKRLVACLKHIAALVQRYVPHPGGSQLGIRVQPAI